MGLAAALRFYPSWKKARGVLKLKASDVIVEGKYEHLKRTRVKSKDGTLILAHQKHALNIVNELGLEDCNPAPTPDLDAEPPEQSEPLDPTRHARYRKCVGHAIYLGLDRYD